MGFLFAPDERYETLADIDVERLARSGVALLLSDLDNTLTRWNDHALSAETLAFAARLRAAGIDLCLISNNTRERIRPIAELLRAEFVAAAHKPLPFQVLRYLRKRGRSPKRCALLGDQLLTDMLCGNLAGARTLLVRPLDLTNEFAGTRVNRALERPLYALLGIHWGKKS